MARRKTTRRKTGTTVAKRRRTRKKTGSLVNFFVPLFFIGCILLSLGFLMFMSYQTVTASSFFELDKEKIEIKGNNNVPRDKISEIVLANTSLTGVWHSDLDAIKREIEKFEYSKEVSVSRVLPDSVRVIVQERIPIALVRLNGKDFWFDVEARKLNRVKKDEERPPFTMFGWDDENSESAEEKNVKRIDLYLELIEAWESFGLHERVKAVDLSDLRDPQAIVEDSGLTVRILLSKDDYGKSLQKGLENIAGRGKEIKSIDMSGVNPLISYRDS